ncbi:hypothetical protein FD755_021438, partial [Muntiacus reevesi]
QSQGFLPWNCSSWHHRKVKSFPKDDSCKFVNLTASLNYKAGRTHIVRQIDMPESRVSKEEVVEARTIVEMLPIVAVSIVDYMETPRGLWTIGNIFVEHISNKVKSPFCRNWHKPKAFTKYNMKKYCQVIHIFAHTQMCLLPLCQKAYLGDTHVNKGTMLQEVTSCLHANKLPCKTHQRLHRVAFFELYYPAWATITTPRSTRSTRLTKEGKLINNNACTDYDLSDKNINPLGDFVRYGGMTNDFVMLKDCIIGTKKQVLTCKSLLMQTKWWFGLHSFQAVEGKKALMGPLKKDRIIKEEGA